MVALLDAVWSCLIRTELHPAHYCIHSVIHERHGQRISKALKDLRNRVQRIGASLDIYDT